MERFNLTAAIRKYPVRANGATDDFVEVVSGLAFAINLGAATKLRQRSRLFDWTVEPNRLYLD